MLKGRTTVGARAAWKAKSEYPSITFDPGSEVPMMFGLNGAHEKSRSESSSATAQASNHLSTSLKWRVIAIVLSAVMVFTLTPTLSFANEDGSAGSNEPAAEQSESLSDSKVEGGDSSGSTSDGSGSVTTPSSNENEGTGGVTNETNGTEGSAGSTTGEGSESTNGSSKESDVDAKTNGTNDALGANNAKDKSGEKSGDSSKKESTSSDDDSQKITVTFKLIGVDADGNDEFWINGTQTVDKETTADKLIEDSLNKANLKHTSSTTAYGYYLSDITSADGRKLGWDEKTGKYWQLFVNDAASEVAASGVTLNEGDVVELYYSSYGSSAYESISVSADIYGIDASGKSQIWASSTIEMENDATAADLTEALFKNAGIKADYDPNTSWGFYLKTITSPFDESQTLGWDSTTGKYWQLFYNGAFSMSGASDITLNDGDTIVWCYGNDSKLPGKVKASVEIIGQDANGNAQRWGSCADLSVLEESTVADLSAEAFKQAGLTYNASGSGASWYLNTITSPTDSTQTLGWDEATGKFWQLFINGKASEVGAGSAVVSEGDEVVWCYSAWGDDITDPDEFIIDPDAERPDANASWPSFAYGSEGAVVQNISTPTNSAELDWSYQLRPEGDWSSISDPLIIDGKIYLVVGSTLSVLDSTTKEKVASTDIGGTSSYFCRPTYADGLIVIPYNNGSLVAFTVDTLTCVWRSAALTSSKTVDYQALSSLTVANGRVYAGFTLPGGMNPGKAGALVCVDLESGNTLWTRETTSEATGQAEGYYWTGAVASGNDIVIGSESGDVMLINDKGEVASTVNIGSPVRSTIVKAPSENGNETFLAVSRDDGKLYKLYRKGNKLVSGKSVSFAATSTSTPAVANGKAYVCGISSDGYGQLSVINLSTMKVEKTITTDVKGSSQSAPLVSVCSGGTYVYFTVNAQPGGVYVYKDGDSKASTLYTPETDKQNWCTASVICDTDGNLYYTNDSGYLFKLKGVADSGDDGDDSGDSDDKGGSSDKDKKDDSSDSKGSGSQDDSSSITPSGTLGGYIAPSSTPISSKQSSTKSSSDSASKTSKDKKSDSSKSSATKSKKDSVTASSDGEDLDGAMQVKTPIWPYVVIALGLAGVLGTLIWLLLGKKRKNDEE